MMALSVMMKKKLLVENIPNSNLEWKNHNLFEIKMTKLDTLCMTKTAENPHPLGPHTPM